MADRSPKESRIRRFHWDARAEITSESELRTYHEQVHSESLFGGKSQAGLFPVCFPLVLWLFGVGIASAGPDSADVLFNVTFIAYFVIAATALVTMRWFDRAGLEALVAIRPAFDVDDVTYYRFVGRFVERLYEPFPHSPTPARRRIHWPVFLVTILGVVLFIVLPVTVFSQQLGAILGLDWGAISIWFQLYIVVLLFIGICIGVVTGWVVFVGAYYMGYKVQQLPIRLDITRRRNNLGLAPYSRVVLKALSAYLFAYLVATTLFFFRESNAVLLLFFSLVSLLPIVGFVGSQYGLHRSIKRSKQNKLSELRESFDAEIEEWFLSGSPQPSQSGEFDVSEFVMAKKAIEELPEWPIRFSSVVELLSATFASNALIALQLLGVWN